MIHNSHHREDKLQGVRDLTNWAPITIFVLPCFQNHWCVMVSLDCWLFLWIKYKNKPIQMLFNCTNHNQHFYPLQSCVTRWFCILTRIQRIIKWLQWSKYSKMTFKLRGIFGQMLLYSIHKFSHNPPTSEVPIIKENTFISFCFMI